MPETLNDDLLQQFMHTFYGYGDYDAPFWFVGMEEASTGTVADINQRLRTWEERGKQELEDLRTWHLAQGATRRFTGRAPLQPTWNGLMRILLSAKGEPTTRTALRRYQKERLGRYGGESCLVELFPLPSPNTSDWLYADHSNLPELKDRRRYRQALGPMRVRHLHSRLLVHRPQAVVFYSTNARYRRWWQKIARTDLEQVGDERLYRGQDGATHFIICKHPVAFGTSNEYFQRIGRMVGS